MSSVIPLRLRTAMLRCSKITELLHSDFPTIHPRSMGIPEAWLHKMILQLQIVEIDAKRSHKNWNFRKLFASLHTSSAQIKELSLLFSHPFHGVHHSFVHLIFTGCWFLNETQKTNRQNTQVSFSCLKIHLTTLSSEIRIRGLNTRTSEKKTFETFHFSGGHLTLKKPEPDTFTPWIQTVLQSQKRAWSLVLSHLCPLHALKEQFCELRAPRQRALLSFRLEQGSGMMRAPRIDDELESPPARFRTWIRMKSYI